MARLGRFIRAKSISDAWQRGLSLIWRQGEEITDERGTRIKEVLSLQIVVEDPYSEMIPAGYSWNEARLEEYAGQLLSGNNPGFEYTYGERLRAWALPGMPPLDQIEQAVLRLRSSSSTRRATAVTWIAPVDSSKEEVPCMIVDDFKLRDGRLNLSVFFRSHDFAGAYPANLYGLARLLQLVAGEVGAEPGAISTTSSSAHIYEHDWDWVERMLTGKGQG
ncbi:MAG: thymidylate synthase [Methanothrix sp.]|jgi:thymidylate synthase|nr:thymidylate synthase [Methanothrix sp.]